ncbi:MAG: cysteine rich repeat-containing protein [Candidatus Binatia bacterium]
MKVWKFVTLIAPLAVALQVAPSLAQPKRGEGPCREDVEKLCPNIKPGGGRYRDCLKQHAAELSPACQEHLKQVKAKAAAWRQACKDDVQKFCSGTSPGQGRIVKCLHQHHDDLSQACKDQIAQARHHRRAATAPAPGQ